MSAGFIYSGPCKAAVETAEIPVRLPLHLETRAAFAVAPAVPRGVRGRVQKPVRKTFGAWNFLIGPALYLFLTSNSVISWAYPALVSLKCDAFL